MDPTKVLLSCMLCIIISLLSRPATPVTLKACKYDKRLKYGLPSSS